MHSRHCKTCFWHKVFLFAYFMLTRSRHCSTTVRVVFHKVFNIILFKVVITALGLYYVDLPVRFPLTAMKCQPSIFYVYYYINSWDAEMHPEEHPSVEVNWAQSVSPSPKSDWSDPVSWKLRLYRTNLQQHMSCERNGGQFFKSELWGNIGSGCIGKVIKHICKSPCGDESM